MSDEYEIRAEEDGFGVYKSGKVVASFRTLKEAEDFKKLKEKEANEQKKFDFKTIISIVLISFSVLGIFIGWCFQKCDDKVLGYFIALISGLLFGSGILCVLINVVIDKKRYDYSLNKRLVISFVVNMFFSGIPTMFVFNDTENLRGLPVLILTLIIFIATFFLLYKFIKINKEDDISPLKATNCLAAFIFTAVKLLTKNAFLIEYYFILPLLLAQALYEFFDSKKANMATPIQSQEEEKK